MTVLLIYKREIKPLKKSAEKRYNARVARSQHEIPIQRKPINKKH
ncbi:hypothetical protein VCR31J2_1270388 [Vibrio coralliirubri]|uniref:Uncharacterized protein n=1 Tax=Vibrio coralliirubri TaxID=1516159 RepID=A0AA87BZ11_9VIBR|nr:hypothetical protein VCR31J2_1270388 [Vibrio coralliirubri]CDT83890.1 hypothetical protein VCR8J2_240120 [Vibrio coralliirubri]CDU15804.1 hypothetical protein VCR17J2_900108 [Vibrio coralliirubri]